MPNLRFRYLMGSRSQSSIYLVEAVVEAFKKWNGAGNSRYFLARCGALSFKMGTEISTFIMSVQKKINTVLNCRSIIKWVDFFAALTFKVGYSLRSL